ncbi:hypothetical protein RD110_20185 [Rhodoferax koreense]|uniref:Response regulatory domain-containing protein n=1 Tax=Rhodoferax koreensis TaxID=1842727 RepID=A0A1P8K4A3_9BURK|nr:response regulator [Rhodoferax koreense]APW40826.1 hypothetical protein RD110_20185 [Rhodoferax koreense]
MSYLYVEDNEDIREAFGALIEADHRHITAVADAEAALALFGTRHFDVLITDVSLPGLSGTDLAREWLKPDPLRWVLLLSGYAFGHGLQGIGANVRALVKTCDPGELEALLEKIEATLAPNA